MTWLDPSPLLPVFQQWAERFPVREPFGPLRHATQTEVLTEAQERQKAGGLARVVPSDETPRQRKTRRDAESRYRRMAAKL